MLLLRRSAIFATFRLFFSSYAIAMRFLPASTSRSVSRSYRVASLTTFASNDATRRWRHLKDRLHSCANAVSRELTENHALTASEREDLAACQKQIMESAAQPDEEIVQKLEELVLSLSSVVILTLSGIRSLRVDIAAMKADHKNDIAAMKADHEKLKADHKNDIAAMKADHKNDIAAMKADHKNDIAALKDDIAEDRSIGMIGQCAFELEKAIHGRLRHTTGIMFRHITIRNLEKNEKKLSALLKLDFGKATLVAQNWRKLKKEIGWQSEDTEHVRGIKNNRLAIAHPSFTIQKAEESLRFIPKEDVKASKRVIELLKKIGRL